MAKVDNDCRIADSRICSWEEQLGKHQHCCRCVNIEVKNSTVVPMRLANSTCPAVFLRTPWPGASSRMSVLGVVISLKRHIVDGFARRCKSQQCKVRWRLLLFAGGRTDGGRLFGFGVDADQRHSAHPLAAGRNHMAARSQVGLHCFGDGGGHGEAAQSGRVLTE